MTTWNNPNDRGPVYGLLRELIKQAHVEVHGVLTEYILEQLYPLEFLDRAELICESETFWAQVPAAYVNEAGEEVTREEARARLRQLVAACR